MSSSSAEQSKQETGAQARPARADWRIVRYVDGDSGETHFAIFRRGRRMAWGLRDRAAAERWLIRQKVPLQQPLPIDVRAAS